MNTDTARRLGLLAAGLLAWPMMVLAQTAPATSPAPAPAVAKATSADSLTPPPDLQQALQMPEGPDKQKAIGVAVKAWLSKDPITAFSWMFAAPMPIYSTARMQSGAAVNVADVKGVADWLIQQPPDRSIMALHGFSIAWTLKDSAAAEAWATGMQAPRDVRYACIFSVGDGLARKKGTDAAAWAATMPAGDDRHAAIDGAATIWCRGHLAEVTAWIKQLPPDDMKWAAMTVGRNWGIAKDKAGLTLEQWADQLPLSADDKVAVIKGPYFDSFHISAYQPTASTPGKT